MAFMQSDKLRYCGCCHRGNMPLPLIAAVWANTMFPTPDPHGLAVVAAPLYPSSHCIVFCCRLSVCHPVSINIFLSLTSKVYRIETLSESSISQTKIEVINEKGEKLFEANSSITYFTNGYAIKDNETYVRTDGTELVITKDVNK